MNQDRATETLRCLRSWVLEGVQTSQEEAVEGSAHSAVLSCSSNSVNVLPHDKKREKELARGQWEMRRAPVPISSARAKQSSRLSPSSSRSRQASRYPGTSPISISDLLHYLNAHYVQLVFQLTAVLHTPANNPVLIPHLHRRTPHEKLLRRQAESGL